MIVSVPKEFSFDLALSFLRRSPNEILHRVEERSVTKALKVDGSAVVFSLQQHEADIELMWRSGKSNQKNVHDQVERYVRDWFDLDSDLKPFYKMAKQDDLLRDLVKRFYGYRIIGQPDLFESLAWAVLGQQINLTFAYKLKQRFVEQFGEAITLDGQSYFLFPEPHQAAAVNPESLLALQFSRQKAAYVIGIAEAFASGRVSKEKIKGLPFEEAKEELRKIKGIGNWTANYALMKTFRYPQAFPLEDAGLHNAIKNLKGMKAKPSLDQVKRIFKKYKGWEAYATLYLWKSL